MESRAERRRNERMALKRLSAATPGVYVEGVTRQSRRKASKAEVERIRQEWKEATGRYG